MATSTIPSVQFANICGSANWGLRFPEDVDLPGVKVLARDLTFDTPYGISGEWKLLELDGAITADGSPRQVLSVFSHGWSADEIDHGASRRVFWVLREAGVTKVLASSTVGSLNKGVLEGDFVIGSDVMELTQTRFSLLPGHLRYDCSGKQLFCPVCSEVVEQTAKALWPTGGRVYGASARLVVGHAWGPRLQSPAEANAYLQPGGRLHQPQPGPGGNTGPRDRCLLRELLVRDGGLSQLFRAGRAEYPGRRRPDDAGTDCIACCTARAGPLPKQRPLPVQRLAFRAGCQAL
ncbi:hypothetical protein LP416_04850 [Polaromonas sp. P2-4]|nr:hypothetical protein LP416_04850 [Polaromonas sp. P2-4]